jgi:membrane protein YdbS with pleckstrin-like domain
METLDHHMTPASVMSVKDWIITLIVAAIPLVGIIMLFVWAFSANENPNRQNYAKAALLLAAIIIALSFLFMALFGGMLYTFMQ